MSNMKILYVTTIGSTMGFFKSLIARLVNEYGCEVGIACNHTDLIPDCYRDWGCEIYPVSWTRSPLAMGNLKGIGELRKVVRENNYEVVHCHTPIAAACTRIACGNLRKTGVKVMYTAHGFHFYRGAPLKNWLVYFPIEWLCSFLTDTLIAINQDDFIFAEKHLHSKSTEYVPGVGIDMEKFSPVRREKQDEKRAELGITDDVIMLLSVGELNRNKNHLSVIRALSGLRDFNWKYYICGRGSLMNEINEEIRMLNLSDRVFLLGIRGDIADLCGCADLFVLPSLREGLPVALMEAIATKTPVLCSRIRGNIDLIQGNVSGCTFNPDSVDDIRESLRKIFSAGNPFDVQAAAIEQNYANLRKYELNHVNDIMCSLYFEEKT